MHIACEEAAQLSCLSHAPQLGCLRSIAGTHTCIRKSKKPQDTKGGAPLKGPTQLTGSLSQGLGQQARRRYLVHLAVVLLVIGRVLWDLGSVRRARVESTGGNMSPPHQTPRRGRHSKTWGVWCCGPQGITPTAHRPEPCPLLGNTIRHPLSWRGQGGRGNLCPWEAPHSPQGSPVRSAGTHEPSAGRTKTRACGVHPPGREKKLSRWPQGPMG